MNTLHGLRGELVIETSPATLARRVASDLARFARARIAQAGTVHLALSGGSSPERLYQLLAAAPEYDRADWARTHLWLVDERCVPKDDPRLNFAMIRTALADRVPIPSAQVHPMPVGRHDGDRLYEETLVTTLGGGARGRLDVVVLGMGPDGHTASLFPHTPALDESARWVVFNDGERVLPPRPRMTLTYPALCSARWLAILVTGAIKHPALREAARTPDDFHEHPIAGITPAPDAHLTWYLDAPAAQGTPPRPI
jgi:6-phosphogluconolactonase